MSLEMVQSSFGDEPVEKSYFPGKGWIPANKMPKKVLREYAHGKRAFESSEVRRQDREHFQEYKEAHDKLGGLARALKGKNKAEVKGKATELQMPGYAMNRVVGPQAEAFAFRQGGKKGGRYLVTRPGASKGTVDHELAHLEPKRSSYRLHQIATQPKRRMREEARADMHAGPGGYHRDKHEPGSGYVQAARDDDARRKMASVANNGGGAPGMFSKENVKEFKNTQDKIYNAGGYRKPKVGAATPTASPKGQRPVKRYVVGGTVATAGAGGGYALHRKQKVKKALRATGTPLGRGGQWTAAQVADATRQAKAFPGRTTRIQEISDTLGVTRNSYNQSMKRAKGQVPYKAQPVKQADRHAEITRRLDAGETPRQIAADLGHSPNYVYRFNKRRKARGLNVEKSIRVVGTPMGRKGAWTTSQMLDAQNQAKALPNRTTTNDEIARALGYKNKNAFQATLSRNHELIRGAKSTRRKKAIDYRHSEYRKKVEKSFQPWDGLHSEVSKYYSEERDSSPQELRSAAKLRPIHSRVFRGKYKSGTSLADDEGNFIVMPGVKRGSTGPAKQVKDFSPHVTRNRTVKKMSPDQSALHVEGFSGQRRKPRLRKLPPDAVRRV